MLRLAIIGDVHYSTSARDDSSLLLHRSPRILDIALSQVAANRRPPDLVVQIGDMVGGVPQPAETVRRDLEEAVECFDRSGLRWTWIVGNHDVVDCGGMKWVLPYLRRDRSYGEMVFGDDVLILLDSSCDAIHGRIDADQQAWLESKLDEHRDRRLFVFVHHVFDWSEMDGMYIENADAIRPMLLESRAVKAIFMGHAHTNRITPFGGLYEIATSALSSWPLTFRWVDIEPARLRVRTEKLDVPDDLEAEALAAWERHPRPYRGETTETDLNADLPLR